MAALVAAMTLWRQINSDGFSMPKLAYVQPGTYLFRFMDHRTNHFWSVVSDILSENKLFLNSRTNFNDPYDSQPIIVDDMRNSTIRAYFNDMLQNPLNPARSPVATLRILEMISTGKTHLQKLHIENIRAGLRQTSSEVLDKAGLLSFSLTAENSLLWAHYASSFTGVCAIFRRSTSMTGAFSVCAKVSYVRERPRLRQSLLHELAVRLMANQSSGEVAEEVFFLSFLHKSEDWAYEQEARIFHPFHAFEKLPFDPTEFVGFILGPNSPPGLETRLRQEIGKRRPSASLIRSSLSQREFRIIIPHKFKASGSSSRVRQTSRGAKPRAHALQIQAKAQRP